jgi:hypothetical protein
MASDSRNAAQTTRVRQIECAFLVYGREARSAPVGRNGLPEETPRMMQARAEIVELVHAYWLNQGY